jgi:hypothetical protein
VWMEAANVETGFAKARRILGMTFQFAPLHERKRTVMRARLSSIPTWLASLGNGSQDKKVADCFLHPVMRTSRHWTWGSCPCGSRPRLPDAVMVPNLGPFRASSRDAEGGRKGHYTVCAVCATGRNVKGSPRRSALVSICSHRLPLHCHSWRWQIRAHPVTPRWRRGSRPLA